MARKQKSFQRTALKILCTVEAIVLVLMIGATVLFQNVMGQINYVDLDTALKLTQEELDAYLATEDGALTDVLSSVLGDVEFEDHSTQIGGPKSNLINIMLIGQDRRPGEARTRSDSMILCTFNKKTGQMTMTSFLRDLYVQIPGYQDNRLNVAYAAGGMSLLNETLKHNFGIHVDGNIEVDFTQFAQLVDLMGGVSMELRQDEANSINQSTGSALSAGKQWLTGSQALAYARIRNLDADGDFSRTNRQRKVVTALLDSYKSADLSTIYSVIMDALPMITTDMSKTDMLGYAVDVFPKLANMELVSQRIPADGTYEQRMIREMAVLVADMDASRQILEETLLGAS